MCPEILFVIYFSEGSISKEIHLPEIPEILHETVETSEKEVLIPIPSDVNNTMAEIHSRDGHNNFPKRLIKLVDSEKLSFFRLSLENYSDYMFNIYTTVELQPGRIRNIAKYQVIIMDKINETYNGCLHCM